MTTSHHLPEPYILSTSKDKVHGPLNPSLDTIQCSADLRRFPVVLFSFSGILPRSTARPAVCSLHHQSEPTPLHRCHGLILSIKSFTYWTSGSFPPVDQSTEFFDLHAVTPTCPRFDYCIFLRSLPIDPSRSTLSVYYSHSYDTVILVRASFNQRDIVSSSNRSCGHFNGGRSF